MRFLRHYNGEYTNPDRTNIEHPPSIPSAKSRFTPASMLKEHVAVFGKDYKSPTAKFHSRLIQFSAQSSYYVKRYRLILMFV